MTARAVRALVLVVVCLLLVGCRADVHLGIDANDDGTGQVRVEVVVDKDVTDRVDLAADLRLDDLKAAGWIVEGPTARPGDHTAIVATMAFRSYAEADAIVEQVAGPTGPFKGFHLTRARSFARTETRFAGTVDAGAGLSSFGDETLTGPLGSSLGIDPKDLQALAGGPVDQDLGLAVSVHLPGRVDSNAGNQTAGGATWSIDLQRPSTLRASGHAYNVVPLAGAGVAVVAALLLVLLLLVRAGRRARRRIRDRA